jgi:hypothetical protein
VLIYSSFIRQKPTVTILRYTQSCQLPSENLGQNTSGGSTKSQYFAYARPCAVFSSYDLIGPQGSEIENSMSTERPRKQAARANNCGFAFLCWLRYDATVWQLTADSFCEHCKSNKIVWHNYCNRLAVNALSATKAMTTNQLLDMRIDKQRSVNWQTPANSLTTAPADCHVACHINSGGQTHTDTDSTTHQWRCQQH